MLADDLADWPDGAILVIDDYHLVIDSSPVEDFMDWLLTAASRIRLVVTSRRRPAWASARRALYGETLEISHEQLAMTISEAGDVLSDRSPAAVQSLVSQTDGWPVLIGLTAISTASDVPNEQVSRDLFRFIAEEVVRHEPSDVQEFMLLASIPPIINLAVLSEILGVDTSQTMLERLVADGLLHESGSRRA